APCGRMRRSIPFERSLAPLVYEADREHAQERHHRPEAENAHLLKRYCPREQEGHFQVEDDEQDGDQVKPDIELHPGVIKGVETALVCRNLFRVRPAYREDER